MPLVYLVHVMIEETYEAFSILQSGPTKPELFGPSIRGSETNTFERYLETQRNLILTDRVLEAALADEALANFSVVRPTQSADPKVELRKKLIVTLVPNTYLIRISYSSRDPKEAYAVVRAVVDKFPRPAPCIQSG